MHFALDSVTRWTFATHVHHALACPVPLHARRRKGARISMCMVLARYPSHANTPDQRTHTVKKEQLTLVPALLGATWSSDCCKLLCRFRRMPGTAPRALISGVTNLGAALASAVSCRVHVQTRMHAGLGNILFSDCSHGVYRVPRVSYTRISCHRNSCSVPLSAFDTPDFLKV